MEVVGSDVLNTNPLRSTATQIDSDAHETALAFPAAMRRSGGDLDVQAFSSSRTHPGWHIGIPDGCAKPLSTAPSWVTLARIRRPALISLIVLCLGLAGCGAGTKTSTVGAPAAHSSLTRSSNPLALALALRTPNPGRVSGSGGTELLGRILR